jgi:hypothetical protein
MEVFMKPLWVVCFIGSAIFLAGCSSGSPQIKPGSPAFFWAVARESYRTGDLVKADTTLQELAAGDSEFAARAQVWHLVLAAGLTEGFSELADAYDSGGPHSANPVRFRNLAANLRSGAATDALEFAQGVHALAAGGQQANIQLAFAFPPGPDAPPEGLFQIANGNWPSEADAESLQTAMLERATHGAAAAAVGAPHDTARARALFQTPETQIPSETFLEGMAELLFEQSDLFAPQRMGRPDRFTLMCREAAQALQSIPETPHRKELLGRIQAALKKENGV